MDFLRRLCCCSKVRKREYNIGYGGALPFDDSKPTPGPFRPVSPVWESEYSVQEDFTTHEGRRITTRARFTYDLERLCKPISDVTEPDGSGHILGALQEKKALPYDDSKPTPGSSRPVSPVWDSESSEQEDFTTHEGRRITTRARFTYALERYRTVKPIIRASGARRKKKGTKALPYDDSKPKPGPSRPVSPVWESESLVQEDFTTHEGSRITTRARFTFGLERYETNVMLILAQTKPHRELIEKRVELLKRSFGHFRFEAEVYLDLGPAEIEARLEDFFSRDFSRVGAVCVAVVGGTGEAGQLPAGALRCPESRVLDKLTSGLPAALAGRPRIYITDMARTGAAAESGVYSLPITSQYPDVIAIHIPVTIEGESSPLQMLCDRLGTERDFKAEVMAAAHEAETAFPELADRPIQVDSTLTLELELFKRTDSLPVQRNLHHGENGSSEHEENSKVVLC